MSTFGFSAFLKFICLNERPQRTEARKRVFKTGRGGYDFHRSLRERVNQYLVEDTPMELIVETIKEITKEAERNSARGGLKRIEAWRLRHLGKIISFPPVTYESPEQLFKVTYSPNFGIRIGDADVAVHVWNTAKPRLSPNLVYAALALVRPLYKGAKAPDDVAVLSLPDGKLYRLSEVELPVEAGKYLAADIEKLLRDVANEQELPRGEGDADRPPTSP